MLYRHVLHCISISSITLCVVLSSLSKENLYLFLKSSFVSILISATGYAYFLKKTKKPTDSHDVVLDFDCPFVAQQKICGESYYIVKLGEDDLIFLLSPGTHYAKRVTSSENDDTIVFLKDDQITVKSPAFWYGTIKIIKL